MDGIDVKRPRKSPIGAGPAKNPRRKNKNGMKIKEEKIPMGPDPGGGGGPGSIGPGSNMQEFGDVNIPTSSKGLQDELLLNGGDIKVEAPSTPQLLDKPECNSDMMPHSDLGHPDFHDCKTPINQYCYPNPHYNNMPPNNGNQPPSHPGDFSPHHGPPPQMMGYPLPNCPPQGQGPPTPGPPPPSQTKQQPSTLEAQYMQQQSQIFVFSTKLANKAAEAVFSGQFPSIIAFHNTHPATRKFLEQYQGNPNWQPPPPQSTAKMGKGNKGQSQHNMIPPPNMPPDFNVQQGHPPPPWNSHSNQPLKQPPQGYPNYYEGGPPFCNNPMGSSPCPGPGGQMMGPGPMGPNHGPNGPHPPYFGPDGNNPPNNLSSGRLTGVQIRDEDLTPEERARREAKLANLSTIGRMLLSPENEHPRPNDHSCHPHPNDNMDGYNMPPGGPPCPMDYMHGQNSKLPPNEWQGPGGGYFPDGQPVPGMKPHGAGPSLPPPGVGPNGNGPRKGGSIPSPVTPLTPGSSCGGAPHRPSPHSPMPGDQMYPGSGGHSWWSPQVGQVQDNSPSAAVQRKDSESSNSEGGKSRKEKSSCSISPTSSAPPSVKEANLMPVPSPQQIQYLNVFEGQELTIQKQPNVGLSDHTTESSPVMPHNNQQCQEINPATPNINQHKTSHSSPPTPASVSSASNQKCTPEMPISSSSNSKPRPGSVGPIGTPKSSTTPNPSPQAGDRTSISQPGTPLQMNLQDMKSIPNPNNFGPVSGPGGPLQPPCMMKQMPLMDPSEGPNGGGVFDNVPLNPNLGGPGPPGAKPAFDPISSMVQMSQQLGGNGNSSNPQGSSMGSGYGMNPPGGGPPMNPNMVNFNTSMHNIQNVDGGMAMGGPQTVNNTYVNATMTIQQMNIQNMPPYMNNSPNMGPMPHQMGPMGGQPMGQHGMPPIGGPGNGIGPVGGPPQSMPNHMGPGPGGQMGPGMCNPGPMPGRGAPPPQMMYGNQQMPRMSSQSVRSSPYRMPNNGGGPRTFGGANVQVKPNAPNTIQYLPARPPPPHNQGSMCSPNAMGGPMHGQPRPGPNLDFLQRYTNPSPGPVVNVNVGMNVNMNVGGSRMNYPGPPQQGMGNHIMCGPMRGPPPPHGMMDDIGPGGVNSGNGQPLPPAGMMGGNMKGGYPPNSSNSCPPPSNDPAYAQQFHHFQQQLYATGSSNGRNSSSMQSNLQGPNNTQNQGFFK